MDASEIAVWAQRFPDAFPRDDTAEDARTRRRLISEAIATDAGPERLRRIAEALGKAQRYHAAASCFHMLHEIAPADLLVLRDLANTLLKARRYAEAVRPLREVADEKAFAKTQFAALNLGRCLIGLGRPEEAIEALQQALALKRDYHATHSALARAYLIVGDEERLATHIGVAREAKPDDLEVRLVSAAWRALSGEPAEAADVLAGLAPRFVEARTLQTLLLQIGDTAPVALHVRKSVASYRTVYVDMLRFFAQFPPRAQARLLSWVRATLDDDLMASWLAGLERHDPNTLDESTCASIAGALAADGEFEAARRWMGRAPAATHRRTPLAIVSDRQSLAGPPLTASDTRNCFRTFLLRDCKQLDDAERWTGRPFEDLLQSLFSSPEFGSSDSRDPAGGRADEHLERRAAAWRSWREDLTEWAVERLPLSDVVKAALEKADHPEAFRNLIVGDEQFRGAFPGLEAATPRTVRVLGAGHTATQRGLQKDIDWAAVLDIDSSPSTSKNKERSVHLSNFIKNIENNEDEIPRKVELLLLYKNDFGVDSFYVQQVGQCLTALKLYDQLLAFCKKAIDVAVGVSDAYWLKKTAEEQLGLLEDAILSGLTAVALSGEPNRNKVLSVGQLAFRTSHGAFGKYAPNRKFSHLARDLLDHARRLGRKDGIVEYEFARMHLFEGATDRARKSAERAVAVNPTSKHVRMLVQCLLYVGHYAEAAALIAQYEFTDDAFEFLRRLVVAFKDNQPLEPAHFYDHFGNRVDVDRLPVDAKTLFHVAEIEVDGMGPATAPMRFRNLAVWGAPMHEDALGLVLMKIGPEDGGVAARLSIQRPRSTASVVLASKAGKTKFGGAEHFLHQSVEEYCGEGFEARFIGLGSEPPDFGSDDSPPCVWTKRDTNLLRSEVAKSAPRLVHSVTGLGYEMMEALRGSAVYHIHGVHFWRDIKHSRAQPENGWFHDLEDAPSRREFNFLLTAYGAVYANSEFTRDVVRRDFGVTLPVVPSLAPDPSSEAAPTTDAEPTAPQLPADFALLVNSREDKGGQFVLDIAERMPEVPFVIIRSQEQSGRLLHEIDKRELTNVFIIDHVADMSQLYRRARVVLVPSFKFVESFSRVPIEAHRHGVPVLGAAVGNIPYILARSGVTLPFEVEAWVAELRRVFTDEAHLLSLQAKARENSEAWSFGRFRDGLRRVIRTHRSPTLVAVGTGIGNMLHTTPMIEWISRHIGAPVDVVISGDWRDSDLLFMESPFVNMIFPFDNRILAKPYDQVFVSHSFGDGHYDFKSNRVFYSRDWRRFDPAGEIHEGAFNIAFAAAALGVETTASRGAYFVGDRTYVRRDRCRRIGIHAGSKGNHWAVKRWPHFGELAKRLVQNGFEVVSFGGASEVVEFSQDLTGLPLDRSLDEIMKCDYFISNDSGLMNVANALGVPQAALFGPTNPHTRGPTNSDCIIIQVDKDCAPCETKKHLYSEKIGRGQCVCMRELSVHCVFEAVLEHMDSVYGETRTADLKVAT